jgi:DNA-binding transcriptional MerR regulator
LFEIIGNLVAGLKREVALKNLRSGDIVQRSKGINSNQLYLYGVMGLIRPAGRTATGRWLYDEGVFSRLAEIARLKRKGRTLQQIRQELASGS